jgi:hypothetical protein
MKLNKAPAGSPIELTESETDCVAGGYSTDNNGANGGGTGYGGGNGGGKGQGPLHNNFHARFHEPVL